MIEAQRNQSLHYKENDVSGIGKRGSVYHRPALVSYCRGNDLDRTNIVSSQCTYLGRTCVCNGNNFDQSRIPYSCRLGSREEGINIHVPFCTEPGERLRCDYRSSPNEGPLRACDVFVVSLFRKVKCKERRPYEEKGPYVRMEEKRQRIVKCRRLDLGVLDKW